MLRHSRIVRVAAAPRIALLLDRLDVVPPTLPYPSAVFV